MNYFLNELFSEPIMKNTMGEIGTRKKERRFITTTIRIDIVFVRFSAKEANEEKKTVPPSCVLVVVRCVFLPLLFY